MSHASRLKKSVGWAVCAGCLTVATMAGPASAALIGDWTFNENGGTTAIDSSASANNGTLTNGVTYVAAPGAPGTNYAAHFDGVDDFIQYAHIAAYDLAGDFTIEAWIKNADATYAHEPLIFGQQVSRFGLSTAGDYVYQYVNNSPSGFNKGGSTGSANAWHHVVAVWDQTTNPSSRRLEIFVDAATNGDYYLFDSTGTVVPGTDGGSFFTGKSNSSATYGYFTGDVDEIRFYNEALTFTQVAANFLAGPTLLVPEPSALALLGLSALALRRVRRTA